MILSLWCILLMNPLHAMDSSMTKSKSDTALMREALKKDKEHKERCYAQTMRAAIRNWENKHKNEKDHTKTRFADLTVINKKQTPEKSDSEKS